jgi:hypothetical protein
LETQAGLKRYKKRIEGKEVAESVDFLLLISLIAPADFL